MILLIIDHYGGKNTKLFPLLSSSTAPARVFTVGLVERLQEVKLQPQWGGKMQFWVPQTPLFSSRGPLACRAPHCTQNGSHAPTRDPLLLLTCAAAPAPAARQWPQPGSRSRSLSRRGPAREQRGRGGGGAPARRLPGQERFDVEGSFGGVGGRRAGLEARGAVQHGRAGELPPGPAGLYGGRGAGGMSLAPMQKGAGGAAGAAPNPLPAGAAPPTPLLLQQHPPRHHSFHTSSSGKTPPPPPARLQTPLLPRQHCFSHTSSSANTSPSTSAPPPTLLFPCQHLQEHLFYRAGTFTDTHLDISIFLYRHSFPMDT